MKRFEEWIVAYRERNNDELLMDSQREKFTTIKNTWRYWCADPHLFEHLDKTYVFAELYDRVLRRGVIGYCQITDSGCTPWTVVLKMPWHLSYPHIIKYNDQIFMIPESYVGNEIAVYKAVSFPDQWVKVKVLKENCVAVDSTVHYDGQSWWMQTLEFDKRHSALNLYALKDGVIADQPYEIARDDENVRPAGKIFENNGMVFRPAQDCTESYGCALNFYHITLFSESDYQEHLVSKILPSSICSDLPETPLGIHTYNVSSKYEVIDLKVYKFDIWYYLMRPIWYILRRVKKLGRK